MDKKLSLDTYCSQFVYILYEGKGMEPKKQCSPLEKHFGLQLVFSISMLRKRYMTT